VNTTSHEFLNLSDEELTILTELLESAIGKLLVEIGRTDHRAFRDDLRRRLKVIEGLAARCQTPVAQAFERDVP
jgi:hypothetical protein